MSNQLKLVCWNVNGIRAVEKKGFIEQLKSWDADIVCLQETKAHKEQLNDELVNIADYESFWHSAEKKGYSSVAIYSRIKPLRIIEGMGVEEFDSEGRVIIAEYEDFYLFCIYFPNAQAELKRIDYRLNFSDALLEKLAEEYNDKDRVLCGDFNVAHKAIDLARPKGNEKNPGYSIEERTWMDKFIDSGYVDTFRHFNTDPENYTWWSYRGGARSRNVGWRIDYFCVNTEATERLVEAGIMADDMGSDHCPISLSFKSQQKA
jgi:exodeoxyribonuclease III